MLDDLVVIDLTRALARPHAAMMLGDLGARTEHLPPPRLGEHDADVRAWLDEKVV